MDEKVKVAVVAISDAARAIVDIDDELFHKMADNDIDVVLPQQLIQMAEFLMDELRLRLQAAT